MLRSASRLVFALFLSLSILLPANESEARGGRSGSSSSFSSSRSSSSSSRSSRSPSFPSRSSSSGFSRPSSSNSRPYSPPPSSSADNAFSRKVNRAGTTSSRDDYIGSRQETASREAASREAAAARARASQPTRFDTEPATRPSYIPQGQVLPNGRYAPIYYDSNQRGYGFWNDLGKWVVLDSILNSHRGGYAQQSQQPYSSPGPIHSGSTAPVSRTASSSSGFGMGFIVILLILAACVWLYFRYSAMKSPLTGGNPGAISPDLVPRSASSTPASKPSTMESWMNLAPGAFVTLSDAQALQDSKDRGEGLKGIDYQVESLAVAKDSEGFGTWVLVSLNDNHQKILLMVKGVDQELDYRAYYQSPEFRPDRREEVIARGDTWLFEGAEMASPNAAGSLRYAREINYSNNGNEVRYLLKGQGERHADYNEKPSLSGMNDMVVTVVEYATGDPTDNPEMLILEIGVASRRTGEVNLFFGCPITQSEVDIVKA